MIGRNDPCWCGSNKKYKKCHLNSDMKTQRIQEKPPGNPFIKTPDEIEGMKNAGKFNGILLDYLRPFVKAGITTEYLNTLAHDFTIKNGHTPASLGYHKFPKSVCISVNDVVCHGIPSKDILLKEGDIVNVDATTIVDGFHGDSSETFLIGEVTDEAKHVVEVAAEAMIKGIEVVGPGKPLKIVGDTIQPFVESKDCSIVRKYTGHGIGKKFHEGFTVCHHISRDCDSFTLLPGMTFTIEPMVNLGTYDVKVDRVDGWTVRTKDGSLSAQFEHTILITDSGAEVLTRTPSQISSGTFLNLTHKE